MENTRLFMSVLQYVPVVPNILVHYHSLKHKERLKYAYSFTNLLH